MTAETLRARPDSAAWQELDGEVVLLVVGSGTYLGMNPSASTLWAELAAGTTRAHLVEVLRTRYDLDTAQATHDVDAFLQTCRHHGLLAA